MKKLWFFVLFCVASSCFADDLSCPKIIEKTKQSISTNIEGWISREEVTPHSLSEARVTSGDPEEDVIEMYSSENSVFNLKYTHIYKWDLKKIKDPFLTCLYEKTNVVLIKSLNNMKICEKKVKQQSAQGQPKIDYMRCY